MEPSATGATCLSRRAWLSQLDVRRGMGKRGWPRGGILYSQREALFSPTCVCVCVVGWEVCVFFLNPRERVDKEIICKVLGCPDCPPYTTFWAQEHLLWNLPMPWDVGERGRRENRFKRRSIRKTTGISSTQHGKTMLLFLPFRWRRHFFVSHLKIWVEIWYVLCWSFIFHHWLESCFLSS